MSKNKPTIKGYLTAKLTVWDWGWADNIVAKIVGRASEKDKGLLMIERIKDCFSISNKDIAEDEKKEIRAEAERIQWTRDEKGNIVSPFSKRAKK